MFVDELNRMGADIRTEGHHAVIRGVERLSAAPVRALDIRAGAAMVIAALDGRRRHRDRGHVPRRPRLPGPRGQARRRSAPSSAASASAHPPCRDPRASRRARRLPPSSARRSSLRPPAAAPARSRRSLDRTAVRLVVLVPGLSFEDAAWSIPEVADRSLGRRSWTARERLSEVDVSDPRRSPGARSASGLDAGSVGGSTRAPWAGSTPVGRELETCRSRCSSSVRRSTIVTRPDDRTSKDRAPLRGIVVAMGAPDDLFAAPGTQGRSPSDSTRRDGVVTERRRRCRPIATFLGERRSTPADVRTGSRHRDHRRDRRRSSSTSATWRSAGCTCRSARRRALPRDRRGSARSRSSRLGRRVPRGVRRVFGWALPLGRRARDGVARRRAPARPHVRDRRSRSSRW